MRAALKSENSLHLERPKTLRRLIVGCVRSTMKSYCGELQQGGEMKYHDTMHINEKALNHIYTSASNSLNEVGRRWSHFPVISQLYKVERSIL